MGNSPFGFPQTLLHELYHLVRKAKDPQNVAIDSGSFPKINTDWGFPSPYEFERLYPSGLEAHRLYGHAMGIDECHKLPGFKGGS